MREIRHLSEQLITKIFFFKPELCPSRSYLRVLIRIFLSCVKKYFFKTKFKREEAQLSQKRARHGKQT